MESQGLLRFEQFHLGLLDGGENGVEGLCQSAQFIVAAGIQAKCQVSADGNPPDVGAEPRDPAYQSLFDKKKQGAAVDDARDHEQGPKIANLGLTLQINRARYPAG